MSSPTQNLGFIIHFAGKLILHIGDAQEITKDDLKINRIYDKKINIAFIPYWNLVPEYDQNAFQDIIHDSDVIATHLGWVEEGIETVMKKIEIQCPDAIIFKEFLVMKTFK
jgi:L-ascorbate metabolism protein UlaG (beta-lactamase superfamily)